MTPEQEHDERQQVITAAFVVITIFAVLCALASSVGADDSAYLRARAAIAINASLTKGGTDAAPSLDTAKPKTEAKPEIWTFYAPFACAPCEAQKADLKAWNDAPFAFRIGVLSNAPVALDSYPTTCWKHDGQWWSYSGWHGTDHLEREWKRTKSDRSRTSATSAAAGTSMRTATPLTRLSALRQFAASYRGQTTGVKGSTLSHLMEPKHGFTAHELQGLTEWELERLHSACHAWGLHASQMRAMADKRGL